ncbi:hypothetical protein D3C71_1450690 [compost metagenome]
MRRPCAAHLLASVSAGLAEASSRQWHTRFLEVRGRWGARGIQSLWPHGEESRRPPPNNVAPLCCGRLDRPGGPGSAIGCLVCACLALFNVLRGRHTEAAFRTQTSQHPLLWTDLKDRNGRMTAGLREHDICVMNGMACRRTLQKQKRPASPGGERAYRLPWRGLPTAMGNDQIDRLRTCGAGRYPGP